MGKIGLFLSFLLVCFCFMVVFCGCKCKDEKEISSWDFGRGADKYCPVLGAYPIMIKTNLKEKSQQKILKKAMERWNKVAREHHPHFVFFASYEDRKSFPRPGGLMGTWPVVAKVHPAPASLRSFGKTCEPLRRGLDPFIQGASLGEVSFYPAVAYKGAKVQVCLEKIKKASKMIGDPVAQRVKEGGLYRVLLHELGHLLGGDGTGHPKTYGEVMRPRPANEAISYHFTTLLRRRVVQPCLKANRWSRRLPLSEK